MQSQTTMLSESFMARSTVTSNILCCMCGLSFNPSQTQTTICLKCITNQTDVSDGITKQGILNFCRMCKRWLRPPWFACERESKQMMALCLQKINGLNKVKLIDAVFKWTEPHSRRIKLKLTIQKEISNNTTIQQTFEVEFFEHWMQCEDCKKEFTPHNWGAMVQIRQKVDHKRTFLFIEQLILKHNAHDKVIKIEETEDGLDFYYKSKAHAGRIIDFLQNTIPITVIMSKQLISQDDQSNIFKYKYSWSVEIPPICRDDLVIIPPKLAKELGGVSTVLLCYKITTTIHLLDPASNKRIDLNAETYFHYFSYIRVVQFKFNVTEFMVTNVQTAEYSGATNKSLNNSIISSISNVFLERVVNVSVQRTSDWKEFHVKSHLGDILKEGTMIEGYDLTTLNCGEDVDLNTKNYPDVILVRKVVDKSQKSRKIWQLKRLEVEGAMIGEGPEAKQGGKKRKGVDGENDMQDFMEEIERNKDLRAKINLFRDEQAIKALDEKQLKKKSRVKKPKGRQILKVKNQSTQIDDSQNQEETKEKEPEDDWDDDDEEDEIKIFELMADLNLNDVDDEEPADVDENEEIVENFIKQIEKIKIQK